MCYSHQDDRWAERLEVQFQAGNEPAQSLVGVGEAHQEEVFLPFARRIDSILQVETDRRAERSEPLRERRAVSTLRVPTGSTEQLLPQQLDEERRIQARRLVSDQDLDATWMALWRGETPPRRSESTSFTLDEPVPKFMEPARLRPANPEQYHIVLRAHLAVHGAIRLRLLAPHQDGPP